VTWALVLSLDIRDCLQALAGSCVGVLQSCVAVLLSVTCCHDGLGRISIAWLHDWMARFARNGLARVAIGTV
jgi:hypothetical protein